MGVKRYNVFFLSRVLRKCLKLKKLTDSFIRTQYGCKMTKLIYGSCYGRIDLKNRAHSIKVFVCSDGLPSDNALSP